MIETAMAFVLYVGKCSAPIVAEPEPLVVLFGKVSASKKRLNRLRENSFAAEFSCLERAGLSAPPLDNQINFWALAPEGMCFQQLTFPPRLKPDPSLVLLRRG
jgi:hypothetical protein